MADRDLDLIQGTLNVLILKTLSWGPRHGYGIARWIQDTTDDALEIGEGSLYPALYRMERKRWIEAEWGKSETGRDVDALEAALTAIDDCPLRVVLLHYSPTMSTLGGEPETIWTFLGTNRLDGPIQKHKPHLVLHGHAHRGSERGMTPGGIRVRNVAQPVLGAPFRVFELDAVPRQLRVTPVAEDERAPDGVLASSGQDR